MRRWFTALLAIPALALLTMTGCGGGDKKSTDKKTGDGKVASDGKKKGDGESKGAGGAIKPGTGKITGKVVLEGDMPKIATLEPVMAKHNDGKYCLMCPDVEKQDQTWIIGKDKGVANVVVWLAPPKGSTFDVVQSTGSVEIDQPHCVYIPHVLAIKPGQKLKIKNSAPMNHNTKWEGDPTLNPPRGQTIPPGKSVDDVELNPQPDPITFKCDFHSWMTAKVWVMDHQYVAVTGPDGTFTIDNVPTDVELRVVAWHEAAGYFHGGKTGKAQTFKAGDTTVDLKVPAK
jgi:hypothetical protein